MIRSSVCQKSTMYEKSCHSEEAVRRGNLLLNSCRIYNFSVFSITIKGDCHVRHYVPSSQ